MIFFENAENGKTNATSNCENKICWRFLCAFAPLCVTHHPRPGWSLMESLIFFCIQTNQLVLLLWVRANMKHHLIPVCFVNRGLNMCCVLLSICQPGFPDCRECRFPLLTDIVRLWGSSQKAAVLSCYLTRKGELRAAALACWTVKDQEGLWGSNFTERKIWDNCATQPFFPHLCEINDIPFARGQKYVRVLWLDDSSSSVCSSAVE